MKRITIVGPAYPYRGGIANFNEMLARTFSARGDKVDILTFTVQYPKILFPGKTQYSESTPPQDLRIRRGVNAVNPFNWLAAGHRLRMEAPDMIIMKYWTPFMAPCLGTIARLARLNGKTKVIVQVDNIVPHEHHFTDRAFNGYFIRSVDGFVYMSQQVKDDLDSFGTSFPALFSPHPIYEGFGESVSREEACRFLGLDPAVSYSMFFGVIRDYKGLDILLDAWKILKDGGHAANRKLIVAGEFYSDRERYLEQIASNGLADEVILHDRFIKDEDVRYYFSAVDLLIQPYKTATQSGVTQIAYNFDVPMIVTRVGGLAEIVPDNVVGFVTEPDPESVAEAFVRFYDGNRAAEFRRNILEEKKRFSWNAMADRLDEVYELARQNKEAGIYGSRSAIK